eukprot:TRINITY_DN7489_c0_g1_i1.p1 TRINITY_DN7489_c0_g1~~TRINITY_DN7489_c0_g1_i1.p1  ORF type:complete len:322 (+),score=125.94 TRINITY_DN7489_c0_g1_i1:120-968(+)
MMRPTAMLFAKVRRGPFARLQHQLMLKVWQLCWGLGPETNIQWEGGTERWLTKLDRIDGEAYAGKEKMNEHDQYSIEHTRRQTKGRRIAFTTTIVEAHEMNFKIPPGELPFYQPCRNVHYDEEKRQYKFMTRPFWWKNLPGDDGLAQNQPVIHVGAGTRASLEPTLENRLGGANAVHARFKPATPEEAAELEAEEQYEREMRNSMQRSIAHMNIVEVPPYYIVGQRTWNSIMPWYKAKKAKGSLSEQERAAHDWTLLVSWPDVGGKPSAAETTEKKAEGAAA